MTGIDGDRSEAFARVWDLADEHRVDHRERLGALLNSVVHEWSEAAIPEQNREGIEVWQGLRKGHPDRAKRGTAEDVPLERVGGLEDGQPITTPASDSEESLRDLMLVHGVGCAAHWFPVKVDADGVVHLPSSAPTASSDWLLVDMVCRWTRRHATVAVALPPDGGWDSVGEPEAVDYDESLLQRILPAGPPSMRSTRVPGDLRR